MLLDKVIAGALVLLSAYMMSHAILLPIGWNGETGGPGGGAFPFWCSLIILICAVFVIFDQHDPMKRINSHLIVK